MRRLNNAGVETRSAVTETGNAVVEFVGIMVVIIAPALLLLVSLGTVLGAQFGVQAAARDAAREVVRADVSDTQAYAADIARQIWSERGHTEPLDVGVSCTLMPCSMPGNDVSVMVSTLIQLPVSGITVPVSATHTMPVDRFRVQP
ncbi:hypothetical protein JTE88_06180 [Arcanobacterium phocisimile]|uniref:TadE-like protein n=1 Tax=Arcanobacterium phocisimile TaxID=1302235 RepID=A0ABX7IEW6_9ACTO|nr:TadE family protein [Arcanobacterium phocisimile]QRV01683.1 hypothetical protein JTE88_06180 [Arcanobacterium phocisimile]